MSDKNTTILNFNSNEKNLDISNIPVITNNDDCHELKNIAYKTMLINGNDINPKYEESDKKKTIINSFLENESNTNKNESWNKLDRTQKIMRLNKYAETHGKTNFNLLDEDIDSLKKYFLKCLDRKNLTKSKEVIYNKDTGEITAIPLLFYNNQNKSFILKKDERHVSTIKSLPEKKSRANKTLKH
tara:strand:- start:146 stop:703 length:558 start_codon:yes stop_codon:yes gene_type:complete